MSPHSDRQLLPAEAPGGVGIHTPIWALTPALTNFCILATYVLNLNLKNEPRNMYFLIRYMGVTSVNQKYVFLMSSAPV